MIEVEIPGPPIAKTRPRFTIIYGRPHIYGNQSRETESVKKQIISQLVTQTNGVHAPVEVEMEFLMPPPSQMSKKEKAEILWLNQHIIKPDIDNMVKFYLDAGNGILWSDDRSIVSLFAVKRYDENPRTLIRIIENNKMSLDEDTAGILALFSPTDYQDIFDDFTEIAENCTNCEGNHPHIRPSRAARAATVLSKLAEKYADKLSKVKKKYPNYHKKDIL